MIGHIAPAAFGLVSESVSSPDATTTYACINGGDNHPKAANKATVQGQVSAGGSFQAKNGARPSEPDHRAALGRLVHLSVWKEPRSSLRLLHEHPAR